MADAIIEQIAEKIAAGTFHPDGWFYLILAVVMVFASAVGAWLVAYFRQKGQNLATKEDFQQLLKQQQEITAVTESIRVEIEAEFGERKEVKALLRSKLEDLIQLTVDLDEWHDHARDNAMNGNLMALSSSPIAKISTLTALYFPKADVERRQLTISHGALVIWNHRLLAESLDAKTSSRQPNFPPIIDDYPASYDPLVDSVEAFRSALIDRYAAGIGLSIEGDDSAKQ